MNELKWKCFLLLTQRLTPNQNLDYLSLNDSLIARSAVYQDPFLTYAAAAGGDRYQLPVSFPLRMIIINGYNQWNFWITGQLCRERCLHGSRRPIIRSSRCCSSGQPSRSICRSSRVCIPSHLFSSIFDENRHIIYKIMRINESKHPF